MLPERPLVPLFGVTSTGGEAASTSMSIATISSIALESPIRHGVTIPDIEVTFPIAMPMSHSVSAMRNGPLLGKRIEVKRRRVGALWRRRKRPNPMVPQRPSPLPEQNPPPIRSKPGEALAVTRKPNPPQRQNLPHTPSKPRKPSLLRARSNPRGMRRGLSRLAGPEPPPTDRTATLTARRAAGNARACGAAVPDMAAVDDGVGARIVWSGMRHVTHTPQARASSLGIAHPLEVATRPSDELEVRRASVGEHSATTPQSSAGTTPVAFLPGGQLFDAAWSMLRRRLTR